MGDQEKIIWNFQESWFLALEFPRDLTHFVEFALLGRALLCLEFPWIKEKNEWCFSGIAQ